MTKMTARTALFALATLGLVLAGAAGATADDTTPPAGEGMRHMRQMMIQENPGMERMHELMLEGNPGMLRMHEQMMGTMGSPMAP